jgi:hypothetical protein
MMLDCVRGFRVASASRATLMNAATALHLSGPQFDATRELSEKEAVAQSALRRLTLELGTYGYFAATALDFFRDTLTEGEIETAANGAGTDRGRQLTHTCRLVSSAGGRRRCDRRRDR